MSQIVETPNLTNIREAINYEHVYEPGWDGSIARFSSSIIG